MKIKHYNQWNVFYKLKRHKTLMISLKLKRHKKKKKSKMKLIINLNGVFEQKIVIGSPRRRKCSKSSHRKKEKDDKTLQSILQPPLLSGDCEE
jgi:predicted transglutaminase-like protease